MCCRWVAYWLPYVARARRLGLLGAGFEFRPRACPSLRRVGELPKMAKTLKLKKEDAHTWHSPAVNPAAYADPIAGPALHAGTTSGKKAARVLMVPVRRLSLKRVQAWASDFEAMSSAGWASEYRSEATIIRGLQAATEAPAGANGNPGGMLGGARGEALARDALAIVAAWRKSATDADLCDAMSNLEAQAAGMLGVPVPGEEADGEGASA